MSLPFPAAAASSADDVRLLAELSHEVRTPMTALLGYVELLLDLPDQNPASGQSSREMLRIVQQSGQHVLELVQSVLDWAKLDVTREASDQSVSPQALCEETIAWLKPRTLHTAVELRCVAHESTPSHMRVNVPRLRQILLNLLGNALKFTHQGEVRAELSGLERDGQPWLCIEVRDTGIGMSDAELARLFTSFSPGSHAACDAGLGLAISHRLCRALGGNLVAESTLHHGSVFRIELPCRLGPAHTGAATVGAQSVAPLPAVGSLVGRRILLADDSFESRRLIALLLRQAGAEVIEAEHGLQVCEVVLGAGENFDLLLVDLYMPMCDGPAATSRLRGAGWHGPIVALTAASQAEAAQRCIAAGCNDVAAKPIDRARLLEVVHRWTQPRSRDVALGMPATTVATLTP